jgi:hypothetical protein
MVGSTGGAVTCIRVCPHWQHFGITRERGKRDDAPEQHRQALRHAVGSGGRANGHLIEEHDLRANISGPTADLITSTTAA